MRRICPGILCLVVVVCANARADTDTPSASGHCKSALVRFANLGRRSSSTGYQIPLPFGVSVTLYSARQPVDLHDLQLGRNGNAPVSVTNVLQINRVDTSQQNASVKFDVLVFPFLDVYALAGYTKGTTNGLIQVPAVPVLNIAPRQLQLNASFHGPTYGLGLTLQGGTRVRESPELIAFAVADVNKTKTDLSMA